MKYHWLGDSLAEEQSPDASAALQHQLISMSRASINNAVPHRLGQVGPGRLQLQQALTMACLVQSDG